MTSRHPQGHELRWLQPLRLDEIAALADNILHKTPAVAKQSLRAAVRLSLTPRAWARVAANTRRLLERAPTFDEQTLIEVLANAAKLSDPAIRTVLLGMLEEPLLEAPRQHLLSALARSEEPAVIPHLMRRLGDVNVATRLAAARDLSIFRRLNQHELRQHLVRELHPAVRFWLAVASAVSGTQAPLVDFFRERRLVWHLRPFLDRLRWHPLRWRLGVLRNPYEGSRLQRHLRHVRMPFQHVRMPFQHVRMPLEQRGLIGHWDWGATVFIDDAQQFVLHERASLLSEQVRRAIAAIPVARMDPRKELQRTLELRDSNDSASTTHHSSPRDPSDTDILMAERIVGRWIEVEPDWQREVMNLWQKRETPEIGHAFARVDARLRGRAVTALFRHQFRRLRNLEDKGPWPYGASDGGEIMCILLSHIIEGAEGIDVGELFQLYWENVQEPVYAGIQLAAAASYTYPRATLVATQEALRSESPQRRQAAVEFIEFTRRYVGSGIPTWGSDGGEPDVGSDAAGAERPETLSYDPVIAVPAIVTPKQKVKIVVDLQQVVGLTGQLRLENVAPAWQALTVDVSIVAPGLRIPLGREAGVITVYSDGTSLPFETEGDVALAEGQSEIRLCALFSFRGRNSGWADIRIGVDAVRAADTPVAGKIEIMPDAEVPVLTLRLIRDELGDAYAFSVLTTEELQHILGMPRVTCGNVRLRREDVAQIRIVLDTVTNTEVDQARSILDGLGNMLYDQLPPPFREAYRALREKLGDTFSIQVITDDPGFPWELARPSFTGSRATFLCETHPIARWHGKQAASQRARLRRHGAILTVAPTYKGNDSLRHAKEEAQWMVKDLGATRLTRVTRERFMMALGKDAPPLAVLHVAAHGSFRPDAPVLSKLVLGSEYLTLAEIRGAQKDALKDALVILNVCEAGVSSGHFGDTIVSLAESFLYEGAAAVIAPLWTVRDGEAFEMMKRCLPRMMSGASVAQVLRDARYPDHQSIDPLAYVLWGDVTAAFS